MKLTVYYENPFWVGVLESAEQRKVRAARQVFGPEPSDAEVLEFVLSRAFDALVSRMTVEVEGKRAARSRISPKRLQRQAAAESRSRGISTYAQQAIQLELAARKLEKRADSRERREAEKERKRELARLKAKAKHRGH